MVTAPRVSTAGNLRMRALRRNMRCAPRASVTVTTAGNPSGTTATATLTAVRNISSGFSFSATPMSMTSPATMTPTSASNFPTLSSRRCKGVSPLSTS